MRIERASFLNASGSEVADLMFDPQVLAFLLRRLVAVQPVDPPVFPRRWIPGRFRVRMRLFGFISLGWQDIVVADAQADSAAQRWALRDTGSGALARRWDHRLSVEGCDDRRARYTDRLDIEAGTLTLPSWLFAQALFAWRRHRWRVREQAAAVMPRRPAARRPSRTGSIPTLRPPCARLPRRSASRST